MSNAHRPPRVIRRDLGRVDPRDAQGYTPERMHIRDVDPAAENARHIHDFMVKQRMKAGYSAYPPGSIGRWVEPAERQDTTAAEDD